MRPYLAVIRDSFHAALSSRILWLAFFAIWLLLAALAPIGYREDFTTTFGAQDFHNGTQMKAMLARGLVDPEFQQKPSGRLAAAMPEELQRQLRRVGEGEDVRIFLGRLAEALNGLLDEEGWYDAEAWKGTVRLRELRELDETPSDELSESLRRRRARLRIESALPGVFQTRAARSVLLTYAGFDFPARFFSLDKTQFIALINQFVVPAIINWLLGFLLILFGILVTAHIMPDLLKAGSLHLLLSKPVSRPLLFLSKFLGGCAFVFLCVIQLVLGLYLIAGLRLDVWNVRMLWCIPVCVFMFAVYYSVSAVTGLRWRSSIVAIGVTCLFWFICFVVGFIGGIFDGLVSRPQAIQHLVSAGDHIVATTRGGGLIRLDREAGRWIEISESDAMTRDRLLPPIKLDERRIATARIRGGRFNPFGLGASEILVLGEPNDWTPEPSLRLPAATSRLYRVGDDHVLAMNSGSLAVTSVTDVLEAAGEEPPKTDAAKKEENEQDWLKKLTDMMGAATEGFSTALPDGVTIAPPRGVIVLDRGEAAILFSRGRVWRIAPPEDAPTGQWNVVAESQLAGEPALAGVVAASGGLLMIARREVPIEFLSADALESIGSLEVDPSLVVTRVAGLGDGRFAVVTSDGRCRIAASSEPGTWSFAKTLATTEVETIHVDQGQQRLYLAHHIDQLDTFDLTSLEMRGRFRPKLDGWRMVNQYGITPLRTVIPQTGELGETIAAMVSGKSAIAIEDSSEDTELVRYKIMRPVISCAAFTAAMLLIGCLYFSRRDF